MLRIKKALIIIVLVNISLYAYIWNFHGLVPFRKNIYRDSSHHYFRDDRINGGQFGFLRALGVWDAQWYLKIADSGYPQNPENIDMNDKSRMDGLTYAFFPLYPLILSAFNLIWGDIELTAFILSQVLTVTGAWSLFYFIKGIYGSNVAYKSVLLFYLYPFGIFFRSYFTEGLFLLFLVWFSYFLIKRSWLKASLFMGLMLVTRPTGLFLLPLTGVLMISDVSTKKLKIKKLLYILPLIFGLFAVWMVFNGIQTGNALYWRDVQNSWVPHLSLLENLKRNLILFGSFMSIPFHDIHASRLDILIFVYGGLLLLNGRKFLKKELWWISFLMWFMPVALRDTTSFSRYQSISFPLFVYLASELDNKWFAAVAGVFFAILLLFSLYFVNWNWLG